MRIENSLLLENRFCLIHKVAQTFEEDEIKGMGPIQLEGKFIDFPIVEKSRCVMKLSVDLGIE